jgi:hypothetical protein
MKSILEMKVVFINCCLCLCYIVYEFVLYQTLICTLLFCRFSEFNKNKVASGLGYNYFVMFLDAAYQSLLILGK